MQVPAFGEGSLIRVLDRIFLESAECHPHAVLGLGIRCFHTELVEGGLRGEIGVVIVVLGFGGHVDGHICF